MAASAPTAKILRKIKEFHSPRCPNLCGAAEEINISSENNDLFLKKKTKKTYLFCGPQNVPLMTPTQRREQIGFNFVM